MDNVWWAISQPVEQTDSGQSSLEQTTPLGHRRYQTTLNQRRYRLVTNGKEIESLSEDSFQCQVTDTQPWKKTSLEEQLDVLEKQLDEHVECLQTFPRSALPYINLQELPAIPEIQDAWLEDTREIIVVSDRSQWSLLTDALAQMTVPQICRYLDRMVQLWQLLAEENCCQSLLVASNLRLREEQIALQQLYFNPPHKQLKFAQLAQMWQTWLEPLGKTEKDLLELVQAAQGDVDLATLRTQLQRATDEPISAFSSSIPDDSCDNTPTVVLPMELRSLSDAGATDIGHQRDRNEDYFGIETWSTKQESSSGQKVQGRGLYIVCDGMGGHVDGELASKMAVTVLQEYFQTHWQDELPSAETIKDGILLANQTIYQVNQENRRTGNQRMGTTLAMALIQNTQMAIATVGDSRIYHVSRRGIEQLSLDHTVGQHEVLRGVEPETAYSRPDAYQLTQALGPSDNQSVSPDLQFLKAAEDTLLLLCSDGLSDNALIENADEYLLPLLSSRANIEQGLHKLMDFADQHNGHDNLTGIIVRVKVQPKLEPTP